jgi:pilus assembly protein Flp/PilA
MRFRASSNNKLPTELYGDTMDSVNNKVAEAQYSQEKGASLVEYALLVALIAVVAISAVGALGTKVNNQFTTINAAIK